MSKPEITPNVICMENEWYNADQHSAIELAQLYGHPNVIISTLMEINNKLEIENNELNNYIRDIEKYKEQTEIKRSMFTKITFMLSIVTVIAGIYFKWS